MAKLKIITGLDNPILRKVSEPVKNFDKSLKKLVKDMKETMTSASGLGLAAPQVGENVRMFLITLDYGKAGQKLIALFNPEITYPDNKMEIDEEGCLSLPGMYGKVERYVNCVVEFKDVDGHNQVLKLSGLNAREVQHENDHLDGIMFPDRMGKGSKTEDLLF
ncbi:peptide deformylase [Candidatus Peregrinibacteria bacterium]|jgi:peptide deformylase|nr:peptide deformylase [Candidatus Peregrinibacteria bacterium]MBT7736373.1 peptide deformylase [Candidatus Peregrinibacteria bacterium]